MPTDITEERQAGKLIPETDPSLPDAAKKVMPVSFAAAVTEAPAGACLSQVPERERPPKLMFIISIP